MKKIKLVSYSIIVLAVLVSCKKKTYPESNVDGEPLFYFTGNVNSVPVDLKAGINDYYMYSSWTQDSNGVYGLTGHLRSSNGSSANSIRILMNSQRAYSSSESCDADSVLYTDYHPIKSGSNPAGGCLYYNLQFFPTLKNGFSPQYSWNFGDGTPTYSSTANAVSHFYKRYQNYNIGLTAKTFSYGTSYINNWFNTKPGSFNAGITALVDSGKTIIASYKNMGNVPPYLGGIGNISSFNYAWDFCNLGGCVGTSSSTSSYNYTNHQTNTIILIVKDQTGAVDTVRYNHATQLSQFCAANYSYSVTPYPNTKNLSNVVINWTDAAGINYTSDHSSQPADSYFRIISEEPYSDNENGQKTKKVHVKFKCTVYPVGTSGAGIVIDNAEAVIAVAYK